MSAAHPNDEKDAPTVNANSNKYASKALKKNSSMGMWVVTGALIIVAALVLGLVWWTNRDTTGGSVELGVAADDKITFTDGAITVGEDSAPKVHIWEDFLCPACGSFESAYGEEIGAAVRQGELQAEFHFLNFLDESSGSGKYSSRAIAAVQCTAKNENVDTFLNVHGAMFADQPKEDGRDDRDAEALAATAKTAGASEETEQCISGIGKEQLTIADNAAEMALDSIKEITDRVSTPTIAHDGEQVDTADREWLQKIIDGK